MNIIYRKYIRKHANKMMQLRTAVLLKRTKGSFFSRCDTNCHWHKHRTTSHHTCSTCHWHIFSRNTVKNTPGKNRIKYFLNYRRATYIETLQTSNYPNRWL